MLEDYDLKIIFLIIIVFGVVVAGGWYFLSQNHAQAPPVPDDSQVYVDDYLYDEPSIDGTGFTDSGQDDSGGSGDGADTSAPILDIIGESSVDSCGNSCGDEQLCCDGTCKAPTCLVNEDCPEGLICDSRDACNSSCVTEEDYQDSLLTPVEP